MCSPYVRRRCRCSRRLCQEAGAACLPLWGNVLDLGYATGNDWRIMAGAVRALTAPELLPALPARLRERVAEAAVLAEVRKGSSGSETVGGQIIQGFLNAEESGGLVATLLNSDEKKAGHTGDIQVHVRDQGKY